MDKAPTTETTQKNAGRSVKEGSQNTQPAEAKSFLQISSGQIQKGIYFSPRLLFSFLDDI